MLIIETTISKLVSSLFGLLDLIESWKDHEYNTNIIHILTLINVISVAT